MDSISTSSLTGILEKSLHLCVQTHSKFGCSMMNKAEQAFANLLDQKDFAKGSIAITKSICERGSPCHNILTHV